MQDLIGRTLGHYGIVEKIGAGGMGVVYRAHDERLDRDVAIKVLPEEVARDEDRLARFEREAKLLASLNHQNIATLYGLEEDESLRFLVMELVDGESLASVVGHGAIPLDEAAPIARQIAEGLEAAHKHGIIHRDLKPANVMVDSEGQDKVLDFGLAKAFDPEASSPQSQESIAESPTLTADLTRGGVLLGTAAYMSPEQARGKLVDKRADIWAFGCTVYEMLTGRRPFPGATSTEILAGVIKEEPEWDDLPADTPTAVRRLLQRCLTKDPRDRLHDIADARIELQVALGSSAERSDQEEFTTPRLSPMRTALPWVFAAIAVAAVVGWIWSARKPLVGLGDNAGTPAVTRFAIELSGEQRVGVDRDMPLFTISADGSRIAWLGGEDPDRRIFTRALDEAEIRSVPGTKGATNQCILLSPDGQEICFTRDDTLWVASVASGKATALFEGTESEHRVFSGDWGPDGTIVIQTKKGLMRIPSGGGAAVQLTAVDRLAGEPNHWNPRFLSDASGLVFTVATVSKHIEMLDFATGERRRVLDRALLGWFLPTGHLLFGRGQTVFAVSVDRKDFEKIGAEVPVLSDVEPIPGNERGPQLAVASDGTIVYMPRQGATDRNLAWVSWNGEIETIPAPPGRYNEVSISPDGTKVASVLDSWPTHRMVILDLNRGVREIVTGDELAVSRVAWSPDGSQVAFSAASEVRRDIYVQSVSGDEPTRLIQGREEELVVQDWSPDGDLLLYSSGVPGSHCQDALLLLPVDKDIAAAETIVSGAGCLGRARFSPDGRWISYVSDEDGLAEVYIREVPPGQSGSVRRQKISRFGGWDPIWSPTAHEVYYQSTDGDSILSVPIRTDPVLEIGEETVILERLRLPPVGWAFQPRQFDIAPDGSRFLMVLEPGRAENLRLLVVRNWFEELKRLVPTE